MENRLAGVKSYKYNKGLAHSFNRLCHNRKSQGTVWQKFLRKSFFPQGIPFPYFFFNKYVKKKPEEKLQANKVNSFTTKIFPGNFKVNL